MFVPKIEKLASLFSFIEKCLLSEAENVLRSFVAFVKSSSKYLPNDTWESEGYYNQVVPKAT